MIKMSITFQVEDKLFNITKDKAALSSYLLMMMDFASTCGLTGPIKLDVDMEHMTIIYELLMNDKIPKCDAVPILDFFDIDCSSSYELSLLHGMYYIKHHDSLKLDKNFGLQYITKEYWDNFNVNRHDDINLLMTNIKAQPIDWNQIKLKLQQLDRVLKIFKSKAVIAGGCIFSALFGCKFNDIDIFFYDFNEDEAIEDIKQMNSIGNIKSICRTSNAVTLEIENAYGKVIKYQIILIKSISPAQILYSFDIDCSAMCYDGKNIMVSNRALHAIKYGMNVVNLDFAGKPYGYRICKYGFKGMAIKIPNFHMESVDVDKLNTHITEWFECEPSEPIWAACQRLTHIDKLLFINAISSKIDEKRIIDYISFDMLDYCCLEDRMDVEISCFAKDNFVAERFLFDAMLSDNTNKIIPAASERFGCTHSNIINGVCAGMQLSNYMCISDESTYVGIVGNGAAGKNIDNIITIPDVLYRTLATIKNLTIPQSTVFEDSTPFHTKKKLYHIDISQSLIDNKDNKYRLVTIIEDKYRVCADKWYYSNFIKLHD